MITGAASGNGRGMAVRFAKDGADIVVADVQEEAAHETANLVREYGRRALVTRTDVSSTADVEAMIAEAVEVLGSVDIMVANAGVAEMQPFLDLTEENWDRVIGVNLKGVFLCGQAAARQMIRQGSGGRIVNIASIMAEVGSSGAAAYTASKGGVKQLTKSMALALAPHGITVNAIGPGFIETAMTMPLQQGPMNEYLMDRTPQERMGDPTDVAAVAAFLVSDEAAFVTGTTVFTDGGFTAGLYSAQLRRMAEAAVAVE